MDFEQILSQVVPDLDQHGIRFALIGGMAMAFRGVQRTTLDVDFILLLDDLDRADQIFTEHGFRREFRSENVSHYLADDPAGRIDVLHAFRGPTLGMLERADRLSWPGGVAIPVVRTEDLIGLKIQASVNDPSRHDLDWSDIRLMLRHAAEHSLPIDWELVADYLELFDLQHKIPELQAIHGQTH